ncbi:hypothetical protein GQF56_16180 [Rhodobacter sphaeroides]|jgi:hypothetical protein|uniref:Uncharacterized protein n=1 Tax=Cereibacter sphaeroides (strain ATCC 17023 / DSM 158 / JCM 6121 / CCUG 31486 / LMG 2827 / NBRC 12203 / NCIMB 8253 / ATH 2.4.1.) TaxID=272943 RepID=Q3IW59_CERS4|nr:hypothetical protein RSP_6255 [Cereibacter sphaeroides 2.4.1]MVX49389.1 hypothetical protein [Cereibacter sphaeroides]AXC63517.1 hypothetical protein DQL45_19230 [Cereibacter sphaeroides 2.4.1]QHA11949.1 hypothetical protein GQR99_19215 [Cereibacter sphaeroides]QHA15098.1 hypothetical protein GQY06_19180 [Cereibacter sphaeroides]
MNRRSAPSVVRFGSPSPVPGLTDEVPPGSDKILVEDELLHGFSFEVWRRTATHLTGTTRSDEPRCTSMAVRDPEAAPSRDKAPREDDSEAALSPPEDLK